jgi:DNA polymerase-3 subunit gamma/tau
MSSFVVSARKYRPITFADVVGQEHVTDTLKNALRNDHLAHAFLFCGPRGVGKTTCARILAKVLNCQNLSADLEPCNTCSSCSSFNENASFNITELDAASNNSVEHIRALIEQVRFQPQQGKYKVFIIDEVHMLSQQAFNAFLKTLEEPPGYAIFILATTEKHKIIPTILSRCQIFDFKRIQAPAMVKHLAGIAQKEGIKAEEDALHIIAQKADGALRDALSIFDRIVSYSGDKVVYDDVINNLNVLDYDYYFRFTDALLIEDLSTVLTLFDEIVQKGFDPDIFINGLAEHFRNILVCKDQQTLTLLETSDNLRERYRLQSQLASNTFLLTALNLANDCDINYRMARNKRLHVEMTLMKMTYINRAIAIQANTDSAALPEKKNPEPNGLAPTAPTSAPENPSNVHQNGSAPIVTTTENGASTPTPSTPIQNGSPEKKVEPELFSMPRFKGIEELMADAKAESLTTAAIAAKPLTLEALVEAWQTYMSNIEQDTTRSLLQPLVPQLEGVTIVVKVNSGLAESTLRDERGLMGHLRSIFSRNDLVLKIELEKTEIVVPKKARPLTNKEKLLTMFEKNPLVKDMTERFGLRFDGE